MNYSENLDFLVEKVELLDSEMDYTDIQSGCWGDSGSDYANTCKMMK
ncbi:MAG TPA: hypothetical protein IAC96_04855 [Candidatus Fimimorpha faecalis]|uniref:Uncharacterized protein n=1 Tax=Candidatus Fimimorpha faecalis TaxID=2840824 RepID=A0A9D1EE64_9FIRM|nr:hypothetical protein [Candidatus Fimimorpha faecalis]